MGGMSALVEATNKGGQAAHATLSDPYFPINVDVTEC